MKNISKTDSLNYSVGYILIQYREETGLDGNANCRYSYATTELYGKIIHHCKHEVLHCKVAKSKWDGCYGKDLILYSRNCMLKRKPISAKYGERRRLLVSYSLRKKRIRFEPWKACHLCNAISNGIDIDFQGQIHYNFSNT